MIRRLLVLLIAALPTLMATEDVAQALIARHVEALVAASKPAETGLDGWFFARNELRSYSRGVFWGELAPQASLAPSDQDPLPAIVDFAAQLKKAGIELLVVPVPGKVAIVPDKLDASLNAQSLVQAPHAQFIALLTAAGIPVLDLAPEFRALRRAGVDSHCHQDTHWSPAGAERCATLIAERIRTQPWYAQAGRLTGISATTVNGLVHGDMVARQKELRATLAKEALTLQRVTIAGKSLEADRASPVVLIGDSHLQVFSNGLQGEGAGLPDHLAKELALRLDVISEQGGGANGPRETLTRRGDRMVGKKVVVWVFTARSFTESDSGWKRIAFPE